MTIAISPPQNLMELAAFLEILNNEEISHIGYCGDNKKEIYDTLFNDFSDVPVEKSFVVAYEKGKIVGAFGLDIDEESKCAEVWGPFIKNTEDYLQIANDLWLALVNLIPFELNEYQFFVNEKNTLARQFIEFINGKETGNHLVLRGKRTCQPNGQVKFIETYNSSFHKSFTALHDWAFSNTYYNSEQILKRISKENQLLITGDNNILKGYVYVEADPLHGEGAIEYIAVSPDFQRQGIAKELMKAALHHLFSYDGIKEITLSVEADNEAAIGLYLATGFQVVHRLIAYKKAENNYSLRDVRSS